MSGYTLDEALTVLDGGVRLDGGLAIMFDHLDPVTRRAALQAFSAVASDGGTDQEAKAAARQVSVPAFHRKLLSASDDALVALFDQLLEIARMVASTAPHYCVDLLEGKGTLTYDYQSALSSDAGSRLVEAQRTFMQSAAGENPVAVDEVRYAADLVEWWQQSKRANLEDAEFLTQSDRWSEDFARACRAALTLGETIRSWPNDRRANLYRGLRKHAKETADAGTPTEDAGAK